MIAYWGAFVRDGSPAAARQPAWPQVRAGLLMSLRPGGRSHTITAAAFAAEHQCGFWNSGGSSAVGAARAGGPRAATLSPNRPSWVTVHRPA
jgi:hypothetical protein